MDAGVFDGGGSTFSQLGEVLVERWAVRFGIRLMRLVSILMNV